LSRFFCNFTPILSFFFLRIFFLGKVFFVHSLKLNIMILLWVDHSAEIFLWNVINVFLVIFILVCYILRDLPVFGWFWTWIKLIFLGIFITLVAGFFKKSIKDWWNDK
jgi:hypothetical protein